MIWNNRNVDEHRLSKIAHEYAIAVPFLKREPDIYIWWNDSGKHLTLQNIQHYLVYTRGRIFLSCDFSVCFWSALTGRLPGRLRFAFLLVLRVILGAFRGAVLAVLLAPALALCYAGTALCWSPMIFCRACTGLLGDRRCTCILTLLLLPLRAPLVLVMSLACLLPAIFLWIVFATLVYKEEEECKNLVCGGVITVEPFSGVADVLPKMTLDWWRRLTSMEMFSL